MYQDILSGCKGTHYFSFFQIFNYDFLRGTVIAPSFRVRYSPPCERIIDASADKSATDISPSPFTSALASLMSA